VGAARCGSFVFALCLPLTGASADSRFLLQNWSMNARVDSLACLGLPGHDLGPLAIVPSVQGAAISALQGIRDTSSEVDRDDSATLFPQLTHKKAEKKTAA